MEYKNHNILIGYLVTPSKYWLITYNCRNISEYAKSEALYGTDIDNVEKKMIEFVKSRQIVVDNVYQFYPCREYGVVGTAETTSSTTSLQINLETSIKTNLKTTGAQCFTKMHLLNNAKVFDNAPSLLTCLPSNNKLCCFKLYTDEQIDVQVYLFDMKLMKNNDDKYVVDDGFPVTFILTCNEKYNCYVYVDKIRYDTELVSRVTEISTITNEFGKPCKERPLLMKPHHYTHVDCTVDCTSPRSMKRSIARFKKYNCEYLTDTCLQQTIQSVLGEMHVKICILPYGERINPGVLTHVEMSKYKTYHNPETVDLLKSPSKCIFDAYFCTKPKPILTYARFDQYTRQCTVRVFASDKEIFPDDDDGSYEARIDERLKFVISREYNAYTKLHVYADQTRFDYAFECPITEIYWYDNVYGVECDPQLLKYKPATKSFIEYDSLTKTHLNMQEDKMHVQMCMSTEDLMVYHFFDAYFVTRNS